MRKLLSLAVLITSANCVMAGERSSAAADLAGLGQANAAEAPVPIFAEQLKASPMSKLLASYSCAPLALDAYFTDEYEKPYTLDLYQAAQPARGRFLMLTREDGKFLRAFLNDDELGSTFIVKEGNLYPAKKHGYIMLSNRTPDWSKLALTVATREGGGYYNNGGFDCSATVKPDMGKKKDVGFSCRTTDGFDKGKDYQLKFSVTGNEFEGDTLKDWEIKVTPADDSTLNALNENTTFSLGENRLSITGDSDGFYMVDLVLFRSSYFTKGYVRTRGEDENQYSKVECDVSGPGL